MLLREPLVFFPPFPKTTVRESSRLRTRTKRNSTKFGSPLISHALVNCVFRVLSSTTYCVRAHVFRTQTYLFVPLSLINFIPLRNNFSSRETAIEQQSSRRTTTRTLDRERRRRREVLKRACRREIGFRFTFSLLEFLSLSLSLSLARAKQIQSTDAHQIPKISLLLYPSWSSSSYNKS